MSKRKKVWIGFGVVFVIVAGVLWWLSSKANNDMDNHLNKIINKQKEFNK